MALTCQVLLSNHPQSWQRATVHPFLGQCQDGTIRPEQFNTWLVQDYHFVVDFTRFVGRVLAAAPASDFEVILAGLQALQDELAWFRAKATERQVSLDVPRQETCQTYCDLMGNLAHAPYPVQATAFWAIELAYNQGWQKPGPMEPPYDEFADRWGNPGFTEYVALLAAQADQSLASANGMIQAQAEAAFLRVAALENAFWQMAYSAG
ncbi:MAG: TenA family transcriptional regulator [Cyanobacteria bacterium]|nr:TenA family transcriptional regulator [Cyanobacteriota bacterium]MDA0865860.1 TenA family transcriptional regulator [Cyanobacteriota bacterium]